jgi:hypothetical protein
MKFIPKLSVIVFIILASVEAGWSAGDPFLFRQIYEGAKAEGDRKEAEKGSQLIGNVVPVKTALVVGHGSRVELASRQCAVRVGGGSDLQLESGGGVMLSNGAVLIQPLLEGFKTEVLTRKCEFSIDGPGCFVIETTSNGGCKVVLLSESSTVVLKNGKERKLVPGNLLFLIPEKSDFGPMVNIDLNAFRATSLLVKGFEKPLEREASIRLAAFKQNFRIKGRTNALIGDAKNADNYEVLFFK